MAKKKKPPNNPDSVDAFDQEMDDEVSKSALKRESAAKQKLGESLTELTDNQLDELNLSDDLRRAVESLQRLQKKGARAHGGMKRQKQYIGKLMRYTEIEPIQAKLDEWQNISDASKVFLHRLEEWRDRILNEGDTAIEELYNTFTIADQGHRQNLRQYHRQAAKEKQAKKPPKSSRLLFKFLRDEVFAESELNSE